MRFGIIDPVSAYSQKNTAASPFSGSTFKHWISMITRIPQAIYNIKEIWLLINWLVFLAIWPKQKGL